MSNHTNKMEVNKMEEMNLKMKQIYIYLLFLIPLNIFVGSISTALLISVTAIYMTLLLCYYIRSWALVILEECSIQSKNKEVSVEQD